MAILCWAASASQVMTMDFASLWSPPRVYCGESTSWLISENLRRGRERGGEYEHIRARCDARDSRGHRGGTQESKSPSCDPFFTITIVVWNRRQFCSFLYSRISVSRCHEMFCFRFFHESSSPKPLRITLGSFRIISENSRRYSQIKVHHWSQRHRRQILPPVQLVLLIPVANCWLKFFSNCHRCQRHRWCTLSWEYLREFSKKSKRP
jgi:hypothetical protein